MVDAANEWLKRCSSSSGTRCARELDSDNFMGHAPCQRDGHDTREVNSRNDRCLDEPALFRMSKQEGDTNPTSELGWWNHFARGQKGPS